MDHPVTNLIETEGFVIASATDVGRKRSGNEDSHALWVSDDPAVRAEVPRMRDVVPAIAEAWSAHAPSLGADFLVSLHTPACVLPPAQHGALFDAPGFGMRVVNPGGYGFDLADSPMEGGRYLPGCAQCRHRPRCNGLRSDYLAVHGGSEFQPVA